MSRVHVVVATADHLMVVTNHDDAVFRVHDVIRTIQYRFNLYSIIVSSGMKREDANQIIKVLIPRYENQIIPSP